MNTEKQFTVAENLIMMVEPSKEHGFLMETSIVNKLIKTNHEKKD